MSQSSSPHPLQSTSAAWEGLNQGQELQGIQVLLVEGDPDIAELLNFILKEAGAEVITAICASEALTQLEAHAPQVLLCDLRLPDHNGDWLIQHIRQQEIKTGQFLPALALSSYLGEYSLQDLFSKGFQGYLDKSSHLEQLVIKVLILANGNQSR